MHKISKYLSFKNFLILLLFVNIVLLLLIVPFEKLSSLDFIRINGDFQNYNIFRRFLSGQEPIKDFPVYLGFGHLYLGSLILKAFGFSIKTYFFSFYLLIGICGFSFLFLNFYLNTKKLLKSFIFSFFFLYAFFYSFGIMHNILHQFDQNNFQLLYAIQQLNTNGLSARAVRFFIVVVLSFVLLVFFKKDCLKLLNTKSILFLGILFGISILWSNDFGISSYVSFSFVFIIFLFKYCDNKANAFKKIFLFWFVSVLSFFIVLSFIANPIEYISKAKELSYFQSWYFVGIGYFDKLSYIYEIFDIFSTLYIVMIFIFIRDFLKESSFSIFSFLKIYISITFFIAAMLYNICTGFNSLFVFCYLIFIVYICSFIFDKVIKYVKLSYFSTIILTLILLICIKSDYDRILSVYSKYRINKFASFEKINKYSDDIEKIKQITKGQDIFSTYAGALEMSENKFQPSGIDYIIHVLSYKDRKKYIDTFLNGKYKYALTINEEEEPWEDWIVKANWFFYKELYKNYSLYYKTRYGDLWIKDNVENFNYLIKDSKITINKINNGEYNVKVKLDNKLNLIADIKLNYDLKTNKLSFLKGLIRKHIFVLYDIKNLRKIAHIPKGIYLPYNDNSYSIPLELKNGVGEFSIIGIPEDDVNLILNSVKIDNLFKISDLTKKNTKDKFNFLSIYKIMQANDEKLLTSLKVDL